MDVSLGRYYGTPDRPTGYRLVEEKTLKRMASDLIRRERCFHDGLRFKRQDYAIELIPDKGVWFVVEAVCAKGDVIHLDARL